MSAIDGRKAKVVNKGERYAAYGTFAKQFGYPDAAVTCYQDEHREPLRNGDIVTLLVGGNHIERPDEGLLWVVETANGEKHIINEKGLRILDEQVTVLTEELGLQREYREVKRKARVGERIKITAEEMLGEHRKGEIYTVTSAAGDPVHTDGKWDDGSTLNPWDEHYVVLEPTDIVRIDGAQGTVGPWVERYRMVERKADVGERVVIVGNTTHHCFPLGSTTLIQDKSPRRVRGEDFYNGWLEHDNYRVLEPLGSTSDTAQPNIAEQVGVAELVRKSHEQQAQIDGLTETVANLARRVAELERGQAPKESPEPVAAKTPTRDEIIDKAKVDVAELIRIGGDRHGALPQTSPLCGMFYDVEFRINRKKRSVVALVFGGISQKLFAKGIAKCAPGDVFNIHIGQVIALRRALGLEIPQEYVNAPQPEEVRVGDVVKYNDGRVSEVFMSRPPYDSRYTSLHFAAKNFDIGGAKILDDSRDGRYGEVYSA